MSKEALLDQLDRIALLRGRIHAAKEFGLDQIIEESRAEIFQIFDAIACRRDK